MAEKYPQKLLVEGKDDMHVIWALCEQFSLKESFDVVNIEGIGNLPDHISLRLKQSGIKTIGIIIDADTEIGSRWEQVRNQFLNEGIAVPPVLPPSGLILSDTNKPKIGVWIMPDNTLNGMLEDFIRFLVPSNDQLLQEVNIHLNNIESKDLQKYNTTARSKATIHSWLACQSDPGTPLGQSITKKYLDTDTEICQTFISWLNNLFNA